MFFQSFDAGYTETGNRQVIVLSYKTSGAVDKAYLTVNERITDVLRSEGMKQLQFPPGYKDRVGISQETFDEMVDHFESQGKLEHHA